ncbi:zinc finger BED domain-containing protein RICESLEEPER 1-like [Mangifera indica]|uniref:zinc finger BED domain-containing protein RICESLEEPER 1-like n=1 Tax=Mangifera indica TaxID=29780 RepID=UPI001CFB80F6|nr:zinc finger BED domain-containing protein RICESLEEPER 1-like [Mangifera indica]
MEAISVGSDPRLYFQVGKIKISEGMKCLQELVQWYKSNFTPENAAILDESMTYLQSLQRQVQETIEIKQQNDKFRTTLNEEMVLDANLENSLGFKRKRCSNDWENFIFVDSNGEERAQCKYCKRDIVVSSKRETRFLKCHLQICPNLRNPNAGANKAKEECVVDRELNGFDVIRKIIKYGLNGIKNGIVDVYKQEKDELCGYLEKIPSHFTLAFEVFSTRDSSLSYLAIKVGFIDDSWKQKARIICLEEVFLGPYEKVLKRLLENFNIDKKICFVHCSYFSSAKIKRINDIFERGSLPIIVNFVPVFSLLEHLEHHVLWGGWPYKILDKVRSLVGYVRSSTNGNKFQSSVKKALSMGKKITSQNFPPEPYENVYLLEWVIGYKEALFELGHIDTNCNSINFTKEDWDKTIALHSILKVVKGAFRSLYNCKIITALLHFQVVFDIYFNLLQWKNSDDHYVREIASGFGEFCDQLWNNCKILVMNVIVDPRFKMDGIEQWFKESYGNEADTYLQQIIEVTTNVYIEYARGINYGDSAISNASPEVELNSYFKDPKVDSGEEFDILTWWHLNASTYPTLARIARDFLPVPKFTGFGYSVVADDEQILMNPDLDGYLKLVMLQTKLWLSY